MMDVTYTAVLRLWKQKISQREIARRLNISQQKVRKILITAGAIDTTEAKLYQDGMTVEQISKEIGKSEKAVLSMLPYIKGTYNAEYPTIRALRTRKSREKSKEVQT